MEQIDIIYFLENLADQIKKVENMREYSKERILKCLENEIDLIQRIFIAELGEKEFKKLKRK